jgi:hypothetical protein
VQRRAAVDHPPQERQQERGEGVCAVARPVEREVDEQVVEEQSARRRDVLARRVAGHLGKLKRGIWLEPQAVAHVEPRRQQQLPVAPEGRRRDHRVHAGKMSSEGE